MREALLKKYFGIPIFIIMAILIAAGVGVVAAITATFHAPALVTYPTHERISIDLDNIPAGTTKTENDNGFIGLPKANYDMTWTLSGSLYDFKSVNIDVYIDYDENNKFDSTENIGTLTKTDKTITTTHEGPFSTLVQYVVTVTVEDNVERTGTSITSEDGTLYVAWDATTP